jgi:hypothetical protein
VRLGRIIVTRQHDAMRRRQLDELFAMSVVVAAVLLRLARNQVVQLFLWDSRFAAIVSSPHLDHAELAGTRSVIHERHKMHRITPYQLTYEAYHVISADFATHVQLVVGTQAAALGGLMQGRYHGKYVVALAGIVEVPPNADTVEHRSDAGSRDLSVECRHCRSRRPAHLGPGLKVGLEVVGMELHKAWDQQVAFEVLPPCARHPRRHVPDPAAGHDQAAAHDLLREHDRCILENQFGGHCLKLRGRIALHR